MTPYSPACCVRVPIAAPSTSAHRIPLSSLGRAGRRRPPAPGAPLARHLPPPGAACRVLRPAPALGSLTCCGKGGPLPPLSSLSPHTGRGIYSVCRGPCLVWPPAASSAPPSIFRPFSPRFARLPGGGASHPPLSPCICCWRPARRSAHGSSAINPFLSPYPATSVCSSSLHGGAITGSVVCFRRRSEGRHGCWDGAPRATSR